MTVETFANLIGGAWVDGADHSENRNPSNLDDLIGLYARAQEADVDRAVEAATKAQKSWAYSTPQQRHDLLDAISNQIMARKDELGFLLSREEGKTLAEGIGETVRAAQVFKFFSGEALRLAGDSIPSVRPDVDVEVNREPVGVVGLITPWNFPIAIPAWKIAPALCYGNGIVFKPADLTPASAHALTSIIHEAGCPAGLFNLVMGRGTVVGNAMLAHDGIHAISFTGSVPVGRGIAVSAAQGAQEGSAGDGRQESNGGDGRCRSGSCRSYLSEWGLFFHRTALYSFFASDRAGRHS